MNTVPEETDDLITTEQIKGRPTEITDVLTHATQVGASDIFVRAGLPTMIKVKGRFRRIGTEAVGPNDTRAMIYSIMKAAQQAEFERERELDFAFNIGEDRYRVNAYMQQGAVCAVFRTVSSNIRRMEDLNLPDAISEIVRNPRGLVLVTGPTGSGKSTTMAAMIDRINRTTTGHILTIEDPVEFVHTPINCVISHREIGKDSHSFSRALKSALRQAPDVILVGEMRDHETISAAISAAETGHLVMGTLHTNSAVETVDRVVDVFPEAQQNQVRVQLAKGLKAVISQQLVPTTDGGRAMAMEIMINNPAIGAMIKDGKNSGITGAILTGIREGMIPMDMALANLVKSRRISQETAMTKALDRKQLQSLLTS